MTVKSKITIKLLAIAAALISVMMLAGCAELTVYDYSDGEYRYNVYELSIDSDAVSRMELSAAKDASGKKYIVTEYFREMFTRLGYELVDAKSFGGAYDATFRKTFALGGTTELDEFGTKVEYTAEYTDGAFVRDVRLTADNPFNGVREKYDDIAPYQTATVLARLKNGWGAFDEYGEWHVSFPSVTDAFPYLKNVDADGLLLKYATTGSARMTSSGESRRINTDSSRYEFARYFDDTDTRLAFEYKRPIVYGWYLVALGAGALTIGIFLLATRKNKIASSQPQSSASTDINETLDASNVNEAIETDAAEAHNADALEAHEASEQEHNETENV